MPRTSGRYSPSAMVSVGSFFAICTSVSGAPTGTSMYWSEPEFAAVRTRWPVIAADYGEDYRT